MLSDRDSRIIGAALEAIADGPFIDDWEFGTLIGLERQQVRAISREWPAVSDPKVTDLAVHNALVNLLGYPHDRWDAWVGYSDASEEEVGEAFRHWTARHPGFRGPRTG